MIQLGTRVAVCLGTRPEAIKLAPVIEGLREAPELDVSTVISGQHREMLHQALAAFDIEPDVDLELMRTGQSLADLTGRAVAAMGSTFETLRPGAAIVHGDTTTALCAALAAFYAGVPVAHVEAGLRSGNASSPFPEEMNRRLIAQLARWHFCPTEGSAQHLEREGVDPTSIDVTGNTAVDALRMIARRELDQAEAARLPRRTTRQRVLVTLHRRETQGAVQAALCRMLRRLTLQRPVDIVLPVHPSPSVMAEVLPALAGAENVYLTGPLEYAVFVHAMKDSHIIVTDSGGIQEEAAALGVPVLVVRETTERPEGVAAGCARLTGIDPQAVERAIVELLEDPVAHHRMAAAPSPYGDGAAAARIVRRLRVDLGTRLKEVGAPLAAAGAPLSPAVAAMPHC